MNAESEKVRRQYAKSAPSTGLAGRRSLTKSDLKQRSNLYLPLKAKLPEEAKKMREEAAKILKSVQEKDEEYDPSKDKVIIPQSKSSEDLTLHRKERPVNSVRPGRGGAGRRGRISFREAQNADITTSTPKKTDLFENYEDLKNTSVPKIKNMPDYLHDLDYLSEEKKSDIWTWLNKGDQQTDFTYFLEVCS